MKTTTTYKLLILMMIFSSCTKEDDSITLLDVVSNQVINLHAPQQGGSGGGAGATEQDCSAISGVSINLLKVQTCMEFWDVEGNNDQNSKYARCITQFGAKP